ncbi:undecaprenyldiphospho-muramoylpentapeptide beta-N-acetylglucosaminyltransferase [Arcanobacterium ihumii]|uniref:undecaprenyldiphospho-muramoylpentapeptide beta-N-acetylglucosaminyltransferase n=1 Tax=Arcanobacterium ihumii TaxID=2138162 RepID=UPI000F52072E|nr:undecaprenyldiphospho-muramoylpentapeptide beta-N-acetylglucosaminyltransferase [Arcanobacterium ihumii]
MLNNNPSVVLAGGGTAGHVNPLLATADALRELNPKVHITAVGTSGGLETQLVPAAGYPLKTIEKVPFPRKPNFDAFTFLPRFGHSIRAAKEILRDAEADVVVGFGGYVSTPIYLAAKSMDIPVVVHEGNARPGMANKLGARFARLVALTFRSTNLKARNGETQVLGLPLAKNISELANDSEQREQLKQEVLDQFGFDSTRPIMVVTGGSLGAQRLNDVVSDCGHDIIDAGIQVLHITGKGKLEGVRVKTEELDERGYRVIDYLLGMEKAYSIADLVLTRSGAGMVAEVTGLGIPAVFVPLPIGNGEQALNAQDVVEAGGALLVSDRNFTTTWFKSKVLSLFGGEKLKEMSLKARAVSPLDGAHTLATKILEIAS